MVDIFNRITGHHTVANQMDIEKMLEMGPIKDSHFQEAIRSLSYTYSKYGLAGNPNVLTWLLGRKPYSFEDYIKNELRTLNLQ